MKFNYVIQCISIQIYNFTNKKHLIVKYKLLDYYY